MFADNELEDKAFEYKVSFTAKEDLRRIYYYGCEELGPQKAEKYFQQFFEQFEKIAANPFIYQSVDHIRPGYRRSPCGVDSIYYRIEKQTIEIMAVIAGQDVNTWLS